MLKSINYDNIPKKQGVKSLDLSTLNFSNILILSIAIAVIYVAVRFVSNIINKIISLSIAIILLLFILSKLGISVPILSDITTYFIQKINLVFLNLKSFLNYL